MPDTSEIKTALDEASEPAPEAEDGATTLEELVELTDDAAEDAPKEAADARIAELAEAGADTAVVSEANAPVEPQPIVIEVRDGKPFLVGDWPQKAKVSLETFRDAPYMDASVDSTDLVITVANGRAVYKFAEDHGAGVFLFNLTDWTRHPEPAADPAAPIAPVAPEAPQGSAVAIAPDGSKTPVETPLRQDGPTLEQFVAAGYKAEHYPPHGYAKRDTPYVPRATAVPTAAVRKDAHLDPTKKCPDCGRYVSAGHRIGCSFR